MYSIDYLSTFDTLRSNDLSLLFTYLIIFSKILFISKQVLTGYPFPITID